MCVLLNTSFRKLIAVPGGKCVLRQIAQIKLLKAIAELQKCNMNSRTGPELECKWTSNRGNTVH